MTIIMIVLLVVAVVVISVLAGVALTLYEQKADVELKLKRYEELYHSAMDGIDKHLY